jgi:hypothetical protein
MIFQASFSALFVYPARAHSLPFLSIVPRGVERSILPRPDDPRFLVRPNLSFPC